jgi:chromatin remodeling complex protein RSC6
MKDPSFSPKSREEDLAWPRLEVKLGVPVARTDVTSYISKYIREHNLQNPEAKREIIPDATLRKIFANPNEDARTIHTYLQVQRYINHHFPKREVKV